MQTTERPGINLDLNLTEKAAEQVRVFMDAESVSPESAGLRVSVMPGGCSGFKYGLNIEEQALEDDIIKDERGIRLFIDAFSAQYLSGTTVDYVSTINGNGFTFSNPNATGGCGCGSSFST